LRENLKKSTHLEDLEEIGWEDVEWIHLNQDREWWKALANIVMNLQVP
jgi:hypothetical protein